MGLGLGVAVGDGEGVGPDCDPLPGRAFELRSVWPPPHPAESRHTRTSVNKAKTWEGDFRLDFMPNKAMEASTLAISGVCLIFSCWKPPNPLELREGISKRTRLDSLDSGISGSQSRF